jgi:ABC-type taurine transport system ATPase subunit
MSDADENGKIPVIVLTAFILLSAVAWGIWTLRVGGGIDPDHAKEVAERAEKECVLEGVEPTRCRELIGENQRRCLGKARTRKQDGRLVLDDQAYMSCMDAVFQEALGEDTAP